MKIIKILLLTIFIIVIGASGYMVFEKIGHKQHGHNELSEDDHEENLEEREEYAIELAQKEIEEIGLETSITGPGTIDNYLTLTGQIGFNQDKLVHIVPRVEGIIKEVNKTIGDTVKTGDVLAVLDSSELADAKAEFLAAKERAKLAQLTFQREEKLWTDKISSEQEYLDSKQVFSEAEIIKRTAEQKLYALGFSKANIENFTNEPNELLTHYEITAPFEGTIIEKHIVLGEKIETDSTIYVIADLSSVWIDLSVYPRDLKHIKKGQDVVISSDSQIPDTNGIISYISPVVSAESRNAFARVVFSNESELYRPGLFVNARVKVSSTNAKVVVHRESIQNLEGQKCVFVKNEHGFEPVFVETGQEDAAHVEITSGLDVGQEYVKEGAFLLKSMIITSTLDRHAGHGH